MNVKELFENEEHVDFFLDLIKKKFDTKYANHKTKSIIVLEDYDNIKLILNFFIPYNKKLKMDDAYESYFNVEIEFYSDEWLVSYTMYEFQGEDYDGYKIYTNVSSYYDLPSYIGFKKFDSGRESDVLKFVISLFDKIVNKV